MMFCRRLLVLTAAALLASCGQKPGSTPAQGGASSSGGVSGAGATFPAPIYGKWATDYRAAGGVRVNYQAIGSGGGIKQIKAQTVDFGASDKPLTPAELEAAGLVQFPAVIGGVVPVVNLPGVASGGVKLTGAVLADIFLGGVTRWNDPAIARLNPGVTLPATPISVVHRSDGSGTSFLFTTYLSMKSPAWKSKVGASDAVQWPTGIGGKGNDGVAAYVKQTPGAVGYVEYAYAKQNQMTDAALQNAENRFVTPTAQSFAAAANGADWAGSPGFSLLLLDKPGAASWPITGATFILLHRAQTKPAQGREALKFVDWAFKNGDAQAEALAYVPLPAAVKDLVRTSWAEIKGADGKPVFVGG